MCQLTLMHGNASLTRVLTYLLMQENSLKNPDGWGFYAKKLGIIKSEKQAAGDPIFLESVEKIKDDIILGHVRFSTYTNKHDKTRNTDINDSHPFDHGNIILAHNGSLFRKDYDLANEAVIDSEDFAIELSEEYEILKDMKLAIQETYSKFDGIFAFLIYCKPENKYYIVRGNKKLLHFCNLKYTIHGKTHYIDIVNTDSVTLNYTIGLFEKIMGLYNGGINIESKTIELIPENSIYEFNPESHSLIYVGEIKEVEHIYKNVYVPPHNIVTHSAVENVITPNLKTTNIETVKSFFDVGYYLSLNGLEVDELQYLFGNLFNIHLFDIQSDTNVDVINRILRYFNIKKKVAWSTIKYKFLIKNPGKSVLDVYKEYNLQFPYFLNGIGKLKKVQKALAK